eukprot:2367479-Pleurochrysis_carterae.AAC.3
MARQIHQGVQIPAVRLLLVLLETASAASSLSPARASAAISSALSAPGVASSAAIVALQQPLNVLSTPRRPSSSLLAAGFLQTDAEHAGDSAVLYFTVPCSLCRATG